MSFVRLQLPLKLRHARPIRLPVGQQLRWLRFNIGIPERKRIDAAGNDNAGQQHQPVRQLGYWLIEWLLEGAFDWRRWNGYGAVMLPVSLCSAPASGQKWLERQVGSVVYAVASCLFTGVWGNKKTFQIASERVSWSINVHTANGAAVMQTMCCGGE